MLNKEDLNLKKLKVSYRMLFWLSNPVVHESLCREPGYTKHSKFGRHESQTRTLLRYPLLLSNPVLLPFSTPPSGSPAPTPVIYG